MKFGRCTVQAPAAVVAQSKIARVASLTAWILIFLALVVFSGWAFHVSTLTNFVRGWATMKPNTAAAFLLAGLALLRRDHRDSFSYSLAVLLIGTATLTEYLSRLDFGIDQLLLRDPYSIIAPGRMSQITSVGFILLGAALALTKSRSETARRVARGFALAAGSLGGVALLGYSYDTQALYRVQPYTSVSLPTAVAFVIAAIGVQCVTPSEGLIGRIQADNAGGEMLRRLLPAALLIPYLLGFAAWIAHKHLGWEMGFSLALIVASTMLCLALIMLLDAGRLEREDLARRKVHRALEQQTGLLQAGKELLKIFVQHVPAAVAMLDRDMRYLQVSDRWCADYALNSTRMLGRSHYEIFPDLPDRWREIHRRGLAGETLRAEEDRWDHADGRTTWLQWEIRPWGRREDGLPEGILIFSEDITARKEAEVERQKFVSLADHSAEFIGICDMNFRPFYVNLAGRRLVGLDSLEQACAVRVQDFFFPEDQAFISDEFFPKVLREGQGEVEVRFRHFKTGGALWMIYNVFQIMGESGQPVGYATVSRDITARKEVEERLRESDATTRALLETAAQAVLAVDPDGTIAIANRMAGEMFGYAANELSGKPLDLLLPERLRMQHALHRADFACHPTPRPMGTGRDLQGLRKDGSEFPVEVSLSSVKTRRGPLAVSFVSDITARKKAEVALRNSEQQLRVLAGSLLTAQEDERRRLSRELHDDVTQRLAFLSIELGRLAGQVPDSLSETRATIRTLQEQTLQASTEVRRLSHGLHPSVIEDFGLSIALEEFCEEFGKAQGVAVSFEGLVEDSRLDDACATCLYRVTQESLRNAVIHGRATEVSVALSLGPNGMELRVKDNGAGFLVDGPRTKRALGVVSMQERIRLVNGTLTISSQPGQGTQISASVPLLEVGHEKIARPAG